MLLKDLQVEWDQTRILRLHTMGTHIPTKSNSRFPRDRLSVLAEREDGLPETVPPPLSRPE